MVLSDFIFILIVFDIYSLYFYFYVYLLYVAHVSYIIKRIWYGMVFRIGGSNGAVFGYIKSKLAAGRHLG